MTRAKLQMLLASSVLALGIAACSGPENPAATATPTETASVDGTVTPAAVDASTTAFVEKAAIGNMFEVEASKIALERSKVQSVKDFAQMMIDAHTAALGELGPLSTTAMVTAPTQLDNDHAGKLEELRTAEVQDFDDKYIDQQTAAHNDALNLMKDYSTNGTDAGLRAFATKMAPDVQSHLDKVKALDAGPADDITKKPSES